VSEPAVIAVLGMGEAGAAIATDLAAAGARVLGWDPRPYDEPAGVEAATSDRAAARSADVVLSVNSAGAAVAVAQSVAPVLGESRLYADLNTGSPGLKRAVAEVVGPHGVAFADVALMAPVPGRGVRTPALAAGPGAERFAAVLGGLGMPVTVLGAEVGAAAARKLARSVFTKGLAAAVGEALAAGERLGCAEWLRADIARTLEEADGATLDRLIDGSRRHARRRVEEMAAAVTMLEELGVEPRVAAASEAWLRSLEQSEVPG
jgi:3-hydroxyisobutyrate dehydrogenase-like beta-hydroxyacid dehydrogenase